MRPSLSGWVEGNKTTAPGAFGVAASMRPSLSGWVEGPSATSCTSATPPGFNEAQPLGLGGGVRLA